MRSVEVMQPIQTVEKTAQPLCICSYEDRPEVMDSLILMGESLCRVDADVWLHLTVPEASACVRAWAESRPQVVLSTKRPDGVTGWDVKPWLLLQELDAGKPEVVWIDTDMIVTRPVSSMLQEFPVDSLILAEEWIQTESIPVSHLWDLPSVRPLKLFNNCFVRATQAHRRLLERWLQMVHDPRYRDAQTIPFDQRPIHLLHDGWLLLALLESEEFGRMQFHCVKMGRHLAQCAGSSGYRPADRLLDLFRGLPVMIHSIGRKPWTLALSRSHLQRYLLDLATDLSPYVLAARGVAKDAGISPAWIDARTAPGAILRGLTAGHPGMAGLPLAVVHALVMKMSRMIDSARKH
jgi:hypothetical protein